MLPDRLFSLRRIFCSDSSGQPVHFHRNVHALSKPNVEREQVEPVDASHVVLGVAMPGKPFQISLSERYRFGTAWT
jgi:hypothetical protein